MNDDQTAALANTHAVHQNRNASAADLNAAAERAYGVVSALDQAEAAAPERENQILAAMTTPNNNGWTKSIAETRAALMALKEAGQERELDRKIALWLAEQLGARARERDDFETARDERR
jgi:hypothetical protein